MSRYFESIAVSRSEFEALKRFPEYEELRDGTLMRMEGCKEFRIYCEDLEEFPIRVMTKGFCAALSEAYDCRMKEARELKTAEYPATDKFSLTFTGRAGNIALGSMGP